ncbi:MAG: hypothetical protein IJP00_03075 [Firmicutes bacterium]|nr:hypothetical protein [Bacillota bacterium]
MVQTREYFEKMLTEMEELLEKVNIQLKDCPAGSLVQYNRNNAPTYFHVFKENGQRKRKGITKDRNLIEKLVRKVYLIEAASILEADIHAIRNFLKTYKEPTFNNVISCVPERFREIGESLLKPQPSGWATEAYKQSDYKPEMRRFTTSRFLKVRSKSELLIAEKLYEHEIDFRYEQVIAFEYKEFAPDFTIRRKSDGKTFYWEHCGRTSDEIYNKHNRWKLAQYEKMGIVPWDNLIITYDTEDGLLNMALIESEIINKLKG